MTVLEFSAKKSLGERLTMATCYDFAFARLLSRTEIDCLLVGDSVAMVVHGHPNTLAADLPLMRLHSESVARGAGEKLVVADIPFLEHRKGLAEAVTAAQVLLRAGAHAVKLEGAAGNSEIIRHLVESGVPVMGHVGLTPQFMNAFGGFRVQGRTEDSANRIVSDAKLLEAAGCFAIVVEGVPAAVGAKITASIGIPTIGIGAGPDCDGQVLVLHDLLGVTEKPPKFVRAFGQLEDPILHALNAYARAVRDGSFPMAKESYG